MEKVMKHQIRHIFSYAFSVILCVATIVCAIPKMAIVSRAEYNDAVSIQMVTNGYAYGFQGSPKGFIYFGTYKQGKEENGEYRTEPIMWRVIDYHEGKLFLVSWNNLDVIPYNNADASVTYEGSSIREWLNGQFLDTAFTELEQSVIQDTTVGKNSDGADLKDKVFLLSKEEVTDPGNGFITYKEYVSENTGVSVAYANNTAFVADGGSTGTTPMAAEGEHGSWWLRESAQGNSAPVIDENGTLTEGAVKVNNTGIAVRPAIVVNLNDVQFLSGQQNSYAVTHTPVGPDSIDALRFGSFGTYMKLTVSDRARTFAAERVGEGEVTPGSRGTIKYSGATLGDNEYISVILLDSKRNFLGYGRIVDNSLAGASESGTAEFTIPMDYAGRDLIVLVHTEQINPDGETDYGSAFSTLNIRVKPDESVDPSTLDLKWYTIADKSYWYESGIKQGTYDDEKGVMGTDPDTGIATNRGREIYDPESGAWYWLDSCYDGAKAANKEVWIPYIFQDEAEWDDEKIEYNASRALGDGMKQSIADGIRNGTGKWVRYDSYGRMIKGWLTIEGPLAELYPEQAGKTYYYDTYTGMMAKGWTTLDNMWHRYHFDEVTGELLEDVYFGAENPDDNTNN